MEFYASPEAEMEAIRRSAKRAGCSVRVLRRAAARVEVVDGFSVVVVDDGAEHTVGEIVCADGWGAARLLLSLAIEDSRTPGCRSLALALRAQSRDDADFARAIHDLVGRVAFVREKGEIFQSGAVTLGRDAGDCDDHFRLAYALGAAGGLRSALGVLYHGPEAAPDLRGPAHAAALFYVGGGWHFAETTLTEHGGAGFGEHPNAAARRLGLTDERSDIAKEVRIMTEQDLPPVPSGWREKNSSVQVALDAEALQRLGFLAPDAPASRMIDPTFSVFRRAVLAFQEQHGLTRDGLVGPMTRAELARALTLTDLGSFGCFRYPGMGTTSEASMLETRETAVTKLTADVSDDDLRAIITFAEFFKERGAKAAPEDWVAVWFVESAGFKNIQNFAGEPYFGYNQMGRNERKNCGFLGTDAEWLAQTFQEQLPFMRCFYESAAKMGGGAHVFRDAGSLYVANIAPAYIKHAGKPDFALYRYRPEIPGMPALDAPNAVWAEFNKTHSDPYAENRTLDRQRKGYISVDDMRIAVQGGTANAPRYRELRDRLRALGATPAAPGGAPSGVGGGAIASIGLVVVGGGLAFARAKGWI